MSSGEVRANMCLSSTRTYTCQDKHVAPPVPLTDSLSFVCEQAKGDVSIIQQTLLRHAGLSQSGDWAT